MTSRARIITVHGCSGGSARTHLVANLGALLAAGGHRVGLLDLALPAPALHTVFGLRPAATRRTLLGHLLGDIAVDEAAYDVTGRIGPVRPGGALYLVPGRPHTARELEHAIVGPPDAGLLADGVRALADWPEVDVVLVDTPAGLSAAAVVALLLADRQLLVATGRAAEADAAAAVRRFVAGPPVTVMAVTAHGTAAPDEAARRAGRWYRLPVAEVLPYSAAVDRAGAGLFVPDRPDDPHTGRLGRLAGALLPGPGPAGVRSRTVTTR